MPAGRGERHLRHVSGLWEEPGDLEEYPGAGGQQACERPSWGSSQDHCSSGYPLATRGGIICILQMTKQTYGLIHFTKVTELYATHVCF